MEKITFLEVDLNTNSACNMNCKYCFLGEKTDFKKPTFNKEYFDGLDLSECKTIEFWGGEPFFYFDEFKEIASYFRKRCWSAELRVVSNGTILNDEIINFLVEEDIIYSMSHDGPDQYLRGVDPLKNEKTIELLKRLPYKIIFSTSVTNKSKGYEEFKKYFYELEDRTHLDFSCKIIPIRGTDKTNMKYAFTSKEDGEKLAKFFTDLIDDCDENIKSRIMFYYTLMRLKTLSKSIYPCSVHENTFLSSHTDGTRQICHSNKDTIMEMAGCKDCIAAGQCYVSCQVLDKKLKSKQCKAAKIMAEAVNKRIASFTKQIRYVPTEIIDITHLAETSDLDRFFSDYAMFTRPITYYVKNHIGKEVEYSCFVQAIQSHGYICIYDLD